MELLVDALVLAGVAILVGLGLLYVRLADRMVGR